MEPNPARIARALLIATLLVIPVNAPVLPTLAAGDTQTYTSIADFTTSCTAGPVLTDISVSDEGGGELGLKPTLEDYFSGGGLDTGTRWRTGTYSGSPTVAVAGGALTIATNGGGAFVASQASYTAGAVEGVVTFGAGQFQHFGFFKAPTLANPGGFDRFAIFSTANTSNQIFARTEDSTGEQRTLIPGAAVGTPLKLRIEWISAGGSETIRYLLDGALVATHTFATANAQPMQIGVSNNAADGIVQRLDWARVTPYTPLSGSYRTCGFSVAGLAPQSWGNFRWTADAPVGTTLTVQARTSDDGTNWSSFSAALANGSTPSALADSRYIQLLVSFSTSDPLVSPRLRDLSFDYAPVPSISINDLTLTEGNSGSQNLVFTVSLSNTTNQPVTVNYATANGSATAGSDYTATSGTLTIPADSISATISVPVAGDLLVEPNETLFVNLSAPTRATIADGQGQGTITNNDATAIGILDNSVNEGDSGTTALTFTLTLTNPSVNPVTVDYATASGSATVGGDYTAVSGTVTFPALSVTQVITVSLSGDQLVEQNETLFINLSNPTDATIADNQATGTITNDDGAVITIADASLGEGNSGTKTLTFTLSLSRRSDAAITVDYATANGSATAGGDYPATSGTVTFPALSTSQTISITVAGDLIVEPDETFAVNLTNPVGATIADNQATGTITNDDSTALSIADAGISEGASGTRVLSFTVTLTYPSASAVTVQYATADGSALAGSDYTAASGTLTFPALSTSQTINVTVRADLQKEPDETFMITLTNPTGATISRAQAIGTITNDDSQTFLPLVIR